MAEQFENGQDHYEGGRLHEAVLCFQRAFEDHALRSRTLNRLGLCFGGLGYKVEAETAFLEAIRVDNGSDANLTQEARGNLARVRGDAAPGASIESPRPIPTHL